MSDSPGTCPHRQKALNGIEHDQARGEFLELGFEEGEVLQGKRLFFVILVKPISRDKTRSPSPPLASSLGLMVLGSESSRVIMRTLWGSPA